MNYVNHDKVEIQKFYSYSFLGVLIKKKNFIIFFYKFFFIYINMLKDLSAKYYQDNKE